MWVAEQGEIGAKMTWSFLFLMILYLFGCAWSSLLPRLFPGWGKWVLLFLGVHRILTMAASFAGEHRLQGMWAAVVAAYEAQWWRLPGFRALPALEQVVVAHRLSCPGACGIFLDRDRTHVSCSGRQIPYCWATAAAAAAAAAKSLQSCPTPWDPIEGSPPGSPVPGILQARHCCCCCCCCCCC